MLPSHRLDFEVTAIVNECILPGIRRKVPADDTILEYDALPREEVDFFQPDPTPDPDIPFAVDSAGTSYDPEGIPVIAQTGFAQGKEEDGIPLEIRRIVRREISISDFPLFLGQLPAQGCFQGIVFFVREFRSIESRGGAGL